jgi:hypothetical protein
MAISTINNSKAVTYPGAVVQIQYYETGVGATGTNTMSYGTSTPTITQGDQYMSLSFTPTSSSNKLKIDVIFQGTSSTVSTNGFTVALFQNGVTNALACAMNSQVNGSIATMSFTHFMTSGTTSAITFSVRAGANSSGTTTFNGQSGTSFSSTLASSITVTEIAV